MNGFNVQDRKKERHEIVWRMIIRPLRTKSMFGLHVYFEMYKVKHVHNMAYDHKTTEDKIDFLIACVFLRETFLEDRASS